MSGARVSPILFFILIVLIGIAAPAWAQEQSGWGFSGKVQGSSNSLGLVVKIDPAVNYTFNHHIRIYFGLPFYAVNPSDSTAAAAGTSTGSMTGLGNVYMNLRFEAENSSVDYVSYLTTTAPTGDKNKGFSTGDPTIDWTNTFSHTFSQITPYGSFGLANTVSDTTFFVRPFTSLGFVSHFDGGATVNLSPVEIGGSAYGVVGAGQQTIVSKVAGRKSTTAIPVSTTGASTSKGQGKGKNAVFQTVSQTVGSSDLADDHGFSGWLGVKAGSNVNLQIGYTRSVSYDLDTLFFGVGFHFGK